MQQTKVDDLLIEMITPKVSQIEQKFSRGEGLTHADINTLLLKAQFNLFSQVDQKLNDVAGSVKILEAKFERLEMLVTQKLESFASNQDLKIERAINTNMRWSIGMIAVIVTVLKLADMFL